MCIFFINLRVFNFIGLGIKKLGNHRGKNYFSSEKIKLDGLMANV